MKNIAQFEEGTPNLDTCIADMIATGNSFVGQFLKFKGSLMNIKMQVPVRETVHHQWIKQSYPLHDMFDKMVKSK